MSGRYSSLKAPEESLSQKKAQSDFAQLIQSPLPKEVKRACKSCEGVGDFIKEGGKVVLLYSPEGSLRYVGFEGKGGNYYYKVGGGKIGSSPARVSPGIYSYVLYYTEKGKLRYREGELLMLSRKGGISRRMKGQLRKYLAKLPIDYHPSQLGEVGLPNKVCCWGRGAVIDPLLSLRYRSYKARLNVPVAGVEEEGRVVWYLYDDNANVWRPAWLIGAHLTDGGKGHYVKFAEDLSYEGLTKGDAIGELFTNATPLLKFNNPDGKAADFYNDIKYMVQLTEKKLSNNSLSKKVRSYYQGIREFYRRIEEEYKRVGKKWKREGLTPMVVLGGIGLVFPHGSLVVPTYIIVGVDGEGNVRKVSMGFVDEGLRGTPAEVSKKLSYFLPPNTTYTLFYPSRLDRGRWVKADYTPSSITLSKEEGMFAGFFRGLLGLAGYDDVVKALKNPSPSNLAKATLSVGLTFLPFTRAPRLIGKGVKALTRSSKLGKAAEVVFKDPFWYYFSTVHSLREMVREGSMFSPLLTLFFSTATERVFQGGGGGRLVKSLAPMLARVVRGAKVLGFVVVLELVRSELEDFYNILMEKEEPYKFIGDELKGIESTYPNNPKATAMEYFLLYDFFLYAKSKGKISDGEALEILPLFSRVGLKLRDHLKSQLGRPPDPEIQAFLHMFNYVLPDVP